MLLATPMTMTMEAQRTRTVLGPTPALRESPRRTCDGDDVCVSSSSSCLVASTLTHTDRLPPRVAHAAGGAPPGGLTVSVELVDMVSELTCVPRVLAKLQSVSFHLDVRLTCTNLTIELPSPCFFFSLLVRHHFSFFLFCLVPE